MKGNKLLLALLFMTISSFDAFLIKKRHFSLYQPNPFFEDRNQLGWQLENPMSFLMKKSRSPFFGPNPYWMYRDSAVGLQNEAKKQGQNEDMGLQNYAKKPVIIGVEIKEPVMRPVNLEEPLVISHGKE